MIEFRPAKLSELQEYHQLRSPSADAVYLAIEKGTVIAILKADFDNDGVIVKEISKADFDICDALMRAFLYYLHSLQIDSCRAMRDSCNPKLLKFLGFTLTDIEDIWVLKSIADLFEGRCSPIVDIEF